MITSLHLILNWERDPIMHKKAVPALADHLLTNLLLMLLMLLLLDSYRTFS